MVRRDVEWGCTPPPPTRIARVGWARATPTAVGARPPLNARRRVGGHRTKARQPPSTAAAAANVGQSVPHPTSTPRACGPDLETIRGCGAAARDGHTFVDAAVWGGNAEIRMSKTRKGVGGGCIRRGGGGGAHPPSSCGVRPSLEAGGGGQHDAVHLAMTVSQWITLFKISAAKPVRTGLGDADSVATATHTPGARLQSSPKGGGGGRGFWDPKVQQFVYQKQPNQYFLL